MSDRGTEVLINEEDIWDHGELEAFERIMTAARRETLPTKMPAREDGYRRLHRYIFQNVFDWAGEYRTVNIAKGSHMFRLVPYIGDQMRQRFAAIQAKNGPSLSVSEEFVGQAVEHIGEINAIHPFREGNGRTLRAFLEYLADEVGLRIALQRIDPVAWIDVSICGFRDGCHEPMRRVIDTAVVAAD
jgi:cell filamentation protein